MEGMEGKHEPLLTLSAVRKGGGNWEGGARVTLWDYKNGTETHRDFPFMAMALIDIVVGLSKILHEASGRALGVDEVIRQAEDILREGK